MTSLAGLSLCVYVVIRDHYRGGGGGGGEQEQAVQIPGTERFDKKFML